MGKQQIVLYVNTHCDGSRTQAKKIAKGVQGVTSVKIFADGGGKERLVVEGEGIDEDKLIASIFKKFKYSSREKVEDLASEAARAKDAEALRLRADTESVKRKEAEKEARRLRDEVQKLKAEREAALLWLTKQFYK